MTNGKIIKTIGIAVTVIGFLCLTNREGDIVLSEGINSKAGRNLLR